MRNLPGKRKLLVALIALSASACSTIEPQPHSGQSLLEQGRQNVLAAQAMSEPVSGPISLDEAIARALKYNLDRRARLIEEAMALHQLNVDHFDMLPKLIGEHGWHWRNNDKISESRNSLTGKTSPSQFISQERSHEVSSLTFSWNLLDVSTGYYKTRQQADRLLVAGERRRKAMHSLMQDVRIAFWQAASAQKLRRDVLDTIAMAEKALDDSRREEVERLRSPLDSLRYQRQIQENLRHLENIDTELAMARIQLADLINAPLSQELQLVEPDFAASRKALEIPASELEETAMVGNADIREQHYNARIARLETRRTLVRLFPNLSFDYALNYDTDSYLVNNEWRDASLRLSFNLFNLLTGPEQLRLAEAGVKLADQRRLAVQMAVLAQTHLARQQLSSAIRQFDRADAIWQIDQRINTHVQNQGDSQVVSPLDVVANRTTSIISLLRRYQALSQVQAAEARLQSALGMEPVVGSTDKPSLGELTREIQEGQQRWLQLGTTPTTGS